MLSVRRVTGLSLHLVQGWKLSIYHHSYSRTEYFGEHLRRGGGRWLDKKKVKLFLNGYFRVPKTAVLSRVGARVKKGSKNKYFPSKFVSPAQQLNWSHAQFQFVSVDLNICWENSIRNLIGRKTLKKSAFFKLFLNFLQSFLKIFSLFCRKKVV